MSDNEKLIEEVAKTIYDDDPDWGYIYEDDHGEYSASWGYLGHDLREKFRAMASRALAIFEEASAQIGRTDDEHVLRVTVYAEPIGDGKESLTTDVDMLEPSTPAWAAGLLRQIADDLVPVEAKGI